MNYDFDYFTGAHLKYPIKPTKPTIGRNPSAIEARAWAEPPEEYEREMKGYQEDKSWYQSEKSRLMSEFKTKLQADYHLSDAEFDTLWDESHARDEGLPSIYNEFDRLYDFVLKFMDVSGK